MHEPQVHVEIEITIKGLVVRLGFDVADHELEERLVALVAVAKHLDESDD